MKTRIILLALFCSTIAHAQSIIDQVFKTIVPETERAFYNFQSIDGQTKILGYGNGISNVYDEKWNTLENHNAGQEELNTGYYYLTRSYQYDSNRKTYTTTAWEKTEYPNKSAKYSYYTWADNYNKFYNGEANILYYLRNVDQTFLRTHSVSTFSDSYTGIAGLLNRVSHYYTALTTEFNIVDWDGNILCKIELPYYISSGFCQAIDVKDKTYVIVTAYYMYPKNVIQDCDPYSTVEYDISSKEVEPGYYHYFIYEYDSKANAIQMVKADKSLANRKEVARYDHNGIKLSSPQKGVNIILYSDGTSNKVIEK